MCLFLIGRSTNTNPWLEMPSHFVGQYIIVLQLLAIICLFGKKKLKATLLIGCSLSIYLWANIYLSNLNQGSPATSREFRIVIANVLTPNQKYEQLTHLIREADPDIVFFMETNSVWVNTLKTDLKGYPYVVSKPREDNFGFLLLSKIELLNPEVIEDGIHPPYLKSILALKNPLEMIAIHPVPPAPGRFGYENRNSMLFKVLNESTGIVIGDLNISQWSPFFRELLQTHDLSSSCELDIFSGTWSPFFTVGNSPQFTGIRIDHALQKGHLQSSCKILPSFGSDHRPLQIDYQTLY